MENNLIEPKAYYVNFSRVFTMMDYYISNLTIDSKQDLCVDLIRNINNSDYVTNDILISIEREDNVYVSIPHDTVMRLTHYVIKLLVVVGVKDLKDMFLGNWSDTCCEVFYL